MPIVRFSFPGAAIAFHDWYFLFPSFSYGCRHTPWMQMQAATRVLGIKINKTNTRRQGTWGKEDTSRTFQTRQVTYEILRYWHLCCSSPHIWEPISRDPLIPIENDSLRYHGIVDKVIMGNRKAVLKVLLVLAELNVQEMRQPLLRTTLRSTMLPDDMLRHNFCPWLSCD